jgi:small-conductance mechanosensitive channel
MINTKNLFQLLEIEPFLILSALVLFAWGFYRLFLSNVTEERHKNLASHYRNLFHHFIIFGASFALYLALQHAPEQPLTIRVLPYLGFVSFLWGMIVFVKTCRVIILQYLFLGSMKHGVPVLLVNIVSLLLSIGLFLWTANHIFNVQVTPLIATSAAVSVILGLALQDTLGNLFAGISLQIDRAFDIGDWVEVQIGLHRLTGQVKEISWRATTLIGWTDEVIIVPNRVLANSQISNFSLSEQPVIRSQVFRMDYGVDREKVRKVLLESIRDVKDIRQWPEPLVLISEATESWIAFKLVYFIDNYGSQYTIADQVVDAALKALHSAGLETTGAKLKILTDNAASKDQSLPT